MAHVVVRKTDTVPALEEHWVEIEMQITDQAITMKRIKDHVGEMVAAIHGSYPVSWYLTPLKCIEISQEKVKRVVEKWLSFWKQLMKSLLESKDMVHVQNKSGTRKEMRGKYAKNRQGRFVVMNKYSGLTLQAMRMQ